MIAQFGVAKTHGRKRLNKVQNEDERRAKRPASDNSTVSLTL